MCGKGGNDAKKYDKIWLETTTLTDRLAEPMEVTLQLIWLIRIPISRRIRTYTDTATLFDFYTTLKNECTQTERINSLCQIFKIRRKTLMLHRQTHALTVVRA